TPVRSDGTAALDLTVGGTFDQPMPTGSLVVRSSSLEYGTLAPVTNLTLDATIEPTLITLRSIGAKWQGMSLGGEGVLPWRGILAALPSSSEQSTTHPPPLERWLSALPAEPSRAGMTLRADDATEAVLKDIVAQDRLDQIQGGVSGTVALDADRLALDSIQATAVFDRAWLTLGGVPFTQNVPTRLRFENGRASITAFEWSAEGNSIRASGGATLTGTRQSIDLAVRGILDLRVLSAFLSGV